MTNTVALVLFALIVAALILDQTVYDGAYGLFAARQFAALVQSLAFWR